MTTATTTVGKFVWHEQVSSDPKPAQDFHTQLFGWETETFKPGEVDYTMISSGGRAHGGFSKAMEGALQMVALEFLRQGGGNKIPELVLALLNDNDACRL